MSNKGEIYDKKVTEHTELNSSREFPPAQPATESAVDDVAKIGVGTKEPVQKREKDEKKKQSPGTAGDGDGEDNKGQALSRDKSKVCDQKR